MPPLSVAAPDALAAAAAPLRQLNALQQRLKACLRLAQHNDACSYQLQRAAQRLAAAAADSGTSGDMAAACACLAAALQLLQHHWDAFGSAQQLEFWCGAAKAALNTLPHLGHMVAAGRRSGTGGGPAGAALPGVPHSRG